MQLGLQCVDSLNGYNFIGLCGGTAADNEREDFTPNHP